MPVEKTLVHSGKGRGSEFAGLLEQVRSAGLLERRPWYYAAKIASTVLALGAGVAAFAALGDSWWQMAVAVYLAVVFAQLGFIGHDAGQLETRQAAGTGLLRRIGVPYRGCGLSDSCRRALRHLYAMGAVGSRVLDEAG